MLMILCYQVMQMSAQIIKWPLITKCNCYGTTYRNATLYLGTHINRELRAYYCLLFSKILCILRVKIQLRVEDAGSLYVPEDSLHGQSTTFYKNDATNKAESSMGSFGSQFLK